MRVCVCASKVKKEIYLSLHVPIKNAGSAFVILPNKARAFSCTLFQIKSEDWRGWGGGRLVLKCNFFATGDAYLERFPTRELGALLRRLIASFASRPPPSPSKTK